MRSIRSLTGSVRIHAESAEPVLLLSSLNRMGIRLYDITYVDEFGVDFTIHFKDYPIVKATADRRGEPLVQRSKTGLLFSFGRFLHRPVLLFGILLLIVASFFLPSRIFFVEVEGNRDIPDRLVAEHAAQAGVKFGALRSSVRSEKLKNTLLEGIPQLQWAGINTRGCVAVITVTERDAELNDATTAPISHVVAKRDGVIRSITVSSGTPLCQTGEAVEEGQVLVSGYTDCGIAIKTQRANAEVFAQTNRDLVSKTLNFHSRRGAVLKRELRYRIIFGKKQINLWKDSGISDTTCVKMYKEVYLTLPGGFVLPIGVGIESSVHYVYEASELPGSLDLEKWSDAYLISHMVCGQIINRKTDTLHSNDIRQLSAKYECIEMIGINRDEELISDYG